MIRLFPLHLHLNLNLPPALRSVLALILLSLSASPALAQPAMIDPSQMSGIPRPDRTVPVGTLSVRVIRGDFAHPLVGQEVTLDGPGGPRTAKSDQTAHATFEGLTVGRGPYTIKSSAFGEELSSQPIEMPPSSGVKIMLVWKADEKALLGQPDGVARADARLPAGTLEVRVVDGDDKPLATVEVVLAHAQRGEEKVEEKRAATDGSGVVRFKDQPVSEIDGYLVSVRRDGASTPSKPFRLQGNAGSLVAIRSLNLTRDAKAISIGKQSHFILEVRDDQVDVIANIILENSSTSPYDPGPAGLVLPLPEGAVNAQLGPQAPAELTVSNDGGKPTATYKGTLPPGETALSIAFVLPQKGSSVRLQQTVPMGLDRLVLVTDRYEGMEVEGAGLEKVEKSMNGRNFWIVSGPAVPAGGTIDVRFTGLPRRSTLGRDLATSLATLIALWGLIAAWRRRGGDTSRPDLERRRAQLLADLGALDPSLPANKKQREDLTAKLERVYRELDSSGDR